MRKAFVGVVVGLLVAAGGAEAAHRFLITSIHQIKPSVVRRLRGNTGAPGDIPALQIVDSPKITLQPGQDSFEVMPNGFTANCPAGTQVIGTGWSGPEGPTGGFVLGYGLFVGGFFDNESSVTIDNVYVEATCGVVPAGTSGTPARDIHTARDQLAAYHRDLLASEKQTQGH